MCVNAHTLKLSILVSNGTYILSYVLCMLQVTPFVDCCVCLLERPDLLPSPLAQARIVSVLLAFVSGDTRGVRGAHSG